MPRFFISVHQMSNSSVTITGEDAHHIARSLRMAVGEHITVCDGIGKQYDCVLERFEDDKKVVARICQEQPMNTESPVQITLYQALPKGDKLDTIIQKAVECGASRIIPFESENCIVRMRADAEARKTERRTRIALEAAKQCGRGLLPTVAPTVDFDDMLESATRADLVLFCYEAERAVTLKQALRSINPDKFSGERKFTLSVIIGSEGGFSEREANRAREKGALPVSLGKRILRTETASTFVLASLAYEFEL